MPADGIQERKPENWEQMLSAGIVGDTTPAEGSVYGNVGILRKYCPTTAKECWAESLCHAETGWGKCSA